MRPLPRDVLAGPIERFAPLDSISEPLQKAARAAIPRGSARKELLSGTWLGHPLHPALTDVVVGAWTSALLLDLLGDEELEPAADALVAAGIAAAGPTAASGLSDWADVHGGTRRVGTVHAFGNVTALVLHAASLLARRRGDRARGKLLSAAGYGAATISAWLGGHLSFGKGVGVDTTAFDEAPADWTAVLDEAELPEGALVGVRADGTWVLLVRRGAELHAIADRCSHRGCALHEGTLEGDTIVCRCHGSTFRLDGSLVRGPATAPQPRYEVRVEAGRVEVRRATAS